MVTHIVGGGLGVMVLLAAVLLSVYRRNVWGVVSGSIYGASLICLYNLDGDFTVYTGHNRATTLAYERTHNRYMRRFGR